VPSSRTTRLFKALFKALLFCEQVAEERAKSDGPNAACRDCDRDIDRRPECENCPIRLTEEEELVGYEDPETSEFVRFEPEEVSDARRLLDLARVYDDGRERPDGWPLHFHSLVDAGIRARLDWDRHKRHEEELERRSRAGQH
jgi:hypothetical protein